jgi:hypothetical protein
MPSRQQQALVVPGIGIEGDFADMNPRFSVLAGPGALVSGPAGIFVGRFAWLSAQAMDPDYAAAVVNNFGFGVPDGFVPRSGQVSIVTPYLADSTLLIQQGAPIWLAAGGGFLVRNSGSNQVLVGMKAYANLNSGLATFAATGAPTSVAMTGSIAAGTAFAGTGSISGNILTITAQSAGALAPGSIITGTGIVTGSQVVAQLTSTASLGALGTTGTYALNIGEQTVASEAIAGTYGVLTVATGGPPVSGATLTGSSPTATVWGQLSATTWVVSPSQTAASITAAVVNVETKWIARSSGLAGELVKMSEILQ